MKDASSSLGEGENPLPPYNLMIVLINKIEDSNKMLWLIKAYCMRMHK